MRNFLKILAVPAGLALASFSPALAAPGTAAAPAVEIDVSHVGSAVTPVHHTWRHTRAQQRWRQNYQRRHYTPPPRYNYRPYRPRYAPPRCYWSRAYQRRICRY